MNPSLDEIYVRWRDERTMDRIGWNGWPIEYWMEGGILRDYFNHKLATSGGKAPRAAGRKMKFFPLLDKLPKDLMAK